MIVSIVPEKFDSNKQYGNLEKIAKIENGINGNTYVYSHGSADCASIIMGGALGDQTMWVTFLSCKNDSEPQLLNNRELQKQIFSTFTFTSFPETKATDR